MRNLLLIATIIVTATVNNAMASNCNITLLKKKADAKTSYTVAGDRLSKKNIEKIAKVCKVQYKLMTPAQVKQLKVTQLKAKLAKLQAE